MLHNLMINLHRRTTKYKLKLYHLLLSNETKRCKEINDFIMYAYNYHNLTYLAFSIERIRTMDNCNYLQYIHQSYSMHVILPMQTKEITIAYHYSA